MSGETLTVLPSDPQVNEVPRNRSANFPGAQTIWCDSGGTDSGYPSSNMAKPSARNMGPLNFPGPQTNLSILPIVKLIGRGFSKSG